MASTERSLGWATSGTGDGPAAGYNADRWTNNARKTDGNGVMLFGSLLALSGTGTSTLTIADGSAIVSGYTYESNGAVTISTTGLTGSYNVILVANTTAGTLAVTATGAGTTTIAASTVRIAIATSAQDATITTAVGSTANIYLGSITTTAGTINTISRTYAYNNSLQVPSQIYAVMDQGSALSVPTASNTDIVSYGASTTSGEGLISLNTTTGIFTVNIGGMYLLDLFAIWDANATGVRMLGFTATGAPFTLDQQDFAISASVISYQYIQRSTRSILLNAGSTVKAYAFQNSGGTRSVSSYVFRITRL